MAGCFSGPDHSRSVDLGFVDRRKSHRREQNDSSKGNVSSKNIQRQYSYDQSRRRRSKPLHRDGSVLYLSSSPKSSCSNLSSSRLYSSKQMVEINEISSYRTIPCRKSRELKETVSKNCNSSRCFCSTLSRPHTAPSLQVRDADVKDEQIVYSTGYCKDKVDRNMYKSMNNLGYLHSDRLHLRKSRSYGTVKTSESFQEMIASSKNDSKTIQCVDEAEALVMTQNADYNLNNHENKLHHLEKELRIIDEDNKKTEEAQVSAHPLVISRGTSPWRCDDEIVKANIELQRIKKSKRRKKHSSTKNNMDPSRIEIITGEGIVIDLEMQPGMSDRSYSPVQNCDQLNDVNRTSYQTSCYRDSNTYNRRNWSERFSHMKKEPLEEPVKMRKPFFFPNTRTGSLESTNSRKSPDKSNVLRKFSPTPSPRKLKRNSIIPIQEEVEVFPVDLQKNTPNSKNTKHKTIPHSNVGIQVGKDLIRQNVNLRCDLCHEEIEDGDEEALQHNMVSKEEKLPQRLNGDNHLRQNHGNHRKHNDIRELSNAKSTDPPTRSFTTLDVQSRFAFWKHLDSAGNLSPRCRLKGPRIHSTNKNNSVNVSPTFSGKQNWDNHLGELMPSSDTCKPRVICEQNNGPSDEKSPKQQNEVCKTIECRCHENNGISLKDEGCECITCQRSPRRCFRRKLPFCEELVSKCNTFLKCTTTLKKELPSQKETIVSRRYRSSESDHGWTTHAEEEGPAPEILFPKETRQAMSYLLKSKEGRSWEQVTGPGILNVDKKQPEASDKLTPYEKAKAIFQKATAKREGSEGTNCAAPKSSRFNQSHRRRCSRIPKCGN